MGMQFPIDVAFLDADGTVVKTMQMRQRRIGVPVWHARLIVEAEAGAFARWGLRVGDVVHVRTDDDHAQQHKSADLNRSTRHPSLRSSS